MDSSEDTETVTLRWKSDGVKRKMIGISYAMPDGNCFVQHFDWPDFIPQPAIPKRGKYHPVKIMGKEILQPRRTTCYGVAYRYSGVTHKLEKTIPDDIAFLMKETARMYKVDNEDKYGKPMTLVNEYPTGRHYISAHSDDEKQMGTVNDVICWVIGDARKVVFRNKKKKIVLEVVLSEGLYIMKGEDFQKLYTHEIPKTYDSFFNRVSKMIPETELSTLEMADWLSENKRWAKANMTPKDYATYKKWNQTRVSFTIRFMFEE